MHLSKEDASLFFKIWLGLLTYVNAKYNVAPGISKVTTFSLSKPDKLLAIRSRLWENKEIISEYVEKNAGTLTKREINILKSWEAYEVSGKFVLMKHLKEYSVFMTLDENTKLYGVSGITDSIGEKAPSSVLPVLLQAVLLPFEDKIIYDSLLLPFDVSFGSNTSMEMEERYREVKNKDGIIVQLPPADVHSEKNQPEKNKKFLQKGQKVRKFPK
jgi:hypothetical protein